MRARSDASVPRAVDIARRATCSLDAANDCTHQQQGCCIEAIRGRRDVFWLDAIECDGVGGIARKIVAFGQSAIFDVNQRDLLTLTIVGKHSDVRAVLCKRNGRHTTIQPAVGAHRDAFMRPGRGDCHRCGRRF